MRPFIFISLLFTVATVASTGALASAAEAPKPLNVCVAIPGNGAKMLSSANSLARIVENVGPVDALSGASSGSILAFFYESIAINPAISRCGTRPCDAEELGLRISLALKSIQGFGETLGELPEVKNLQAIVTNFSELKAKFRFIYRIRDDIKFVSAVKELLASQLVRELLNPAIFSSLDLRNATHLRSQLGRLAEMFNFDNIFSGNDRDLLYRDGVLNIEGAVRTVGRVGDFYAGKSVDQTQSWARFFEACAPLVKLQSWSRIRTAKPEGLSGPSCGEHLSRMVRINGYLSASLPSRRIEDPIGAVVPALVSSSVLTGPNVEPGYLVARKKFLRFERSISFTPGYDALRLGYYGPAALLDTLLSTPRSKDEGPLAERRFRLGTYPWRIALQHSIAEPGLSQMLKADDLPGTYTAGGWIHADHTIALKDVGCTNVAFITARGIEARFPTLVLNNLVGATPAQSDAIYSLDSQRNPPSSLARSLKAADAVVCTDWESLKDVQQLELVDDALKAPVEIRSLAFRRGSFRYMPEDLDLVGCSASLPRLK